MIGGDADTTFNWTSISSAVTGSTQPAFGAALAGIDHNRVAGQAKAQEGYIAWMRWRFMGDQAGHDMFVGSELQDLHGRRVLWRREDSRAWTPYDRTRPTTEEGTYMERDQMVTIKLVAAIAAGLPAVGRRPRQTCRQRRRRVTTRSVASHPHGMVMSTTYPTGATA